jgi:hypothetical protein
MPCEPECLQHTPFRDSGIYLVTGRAGPLGEAVSEHLIRTYNAQLIYIDSREGLDQACEDIRSRGLHVNGLIDAASELQMDTALQLLEMDWCASLDFALFFAPAESFTKTAGQGERAAAACFTDARVHALASTLPIPVKIMNLPSAADALDFACVDRLLSSSYVQLVCAHSLEDLESNGVMAQERLETRGFPAPSLLEHLRVSLGDFTRGERSNVN